MKPAALWQCVQKALSPQLSELGFSRIKASPPVWTRPQGELVATIWLKSRSAGYVAGVGGLFTGALQVASISRPGIEAVVGAEGSFWSHRFDQLLSQKERTRALALYADVARRRTTQRDERPVPWDIWANYLDEADVQAWMALLEPAIVRALGTPV